MSGVKLYPKPPFTEKDWERGQGREKLRGGRSPAGGKNMEHFQKPVSTRCSNSDGLLAVSNLVLNKI